MIDKNRIIYSKKQILAFSLIELLITLIIISVILTALAPVISKRLQYRNLNYAASSIGTDCSKFGNQCLICSNKGCSLCSNQFNVQSGYYVDPNDNCEVKQCPEGCLDCSVNGCTSCKEGYGYNSSDMTCTKVR